MKLEGNNVRRKSQLRWEVKSLNVWGGKGDVTTLNSWEIKKAKILNFLANISISIEVDRGASFTSRQLKQPIHEVDELAVPADKYWEVLAVPANKY